MTTELVWTQEEAIKLCVEIEKVCPKYHYHVALTGGSLYKDGPRKDLDILFYSVRQQTSDRCGLEEALMEIFNFHDIRIYGWLTKVKYNEKEIDMFFPEYPKIINGEGSDY